MDASLLNELNEFNGMHVAMAVELRVGDQVDLSFSKASENTARCFKDAVTWHDETLRPIEEKRFP